MKTYHIIDKSNRNTKAELIHYTFEQLKEFFKPDLELNEDVEEWKKIQDLYDLEEYLKKQACGMEQPYEFELDEVEDFESLKSANEFFLMQDN